MMPARLTSGTLTAVTTAELLAMPEDGTERELIRGELRARPMTRRSPAHSEVTVTIGYLLKSWLKQQPLPRGRVLGGEAGVRLRRDPDTTVGIDVAYISPELAAATPWRAKLVDGLPTLAVEILSPSDRHEEIADKVEEYVDAGVPLVWVVDPYFQTVEVFRPGAPPELFNVNGELSGMPELPGFSAAVSEIFDS